MKLSNLTFLFFYLINCDEKYLGISKYKRKFIYSLGTMGIYVETEKSNQIMFSLIQTLNDINVNSQGNIISKS